MMMRLQQMPSDAKEILHESMHGQESLRLPRSFNFRICRSRCRVGSCETSARLFLYWSVSWTTDGMTSR